MKTSTILALMLTLVCALYGSVQPDKVYLHLDRNIYAQGDTIWIKGYVMERGSNTPSDKSYAIHVQMLDEAGSQVGAYKLLTIDGQAIGQIEVSGIQKPGFYQIVAHTGYMKNFDQRFFFKTTIEVREKVRRRSISTLFDKAHYTAGDTAHITFSVVDRNQSPVSGARFIYEYFVGEERILRDGVKCYDDGTMKVNLPIGNELIGIEPRIQLSYFSDDGNVNRTKQDVYIPIGKKHLNLTFFPEGGDRLIGAMSKIAFKANDDQGNAIEIKAEIYKDGKAFKKISTLHDGMGILSLTGDTSTYTCKVTSPSWIDSIYVLPNAKEDGYTLSFKGQTDEMLYLSATHNGVTSQSGKLWISYCDSLLSVSTIEIDRNIRIPISKSHLPEGIVTFTLSDATGEPQAERLVYIEKPSSPIAITTDKNNYQVRERVKLTINAPANAQLSFAIVDSTRGYNPEINSTSIKAYAHLETELQGRINNINQYLCKSESVTKKRDLLLMTHGWRRFEWINNRQSLATMQIHDFNRVYGKVTRFGKPYPKAKIGAYMLGESIAFTQFRTDEQGRFFLDPNYKIRTYKDMVITARNKKDRSGVTLTIQNTDTLLFASILKNNQDYLKPYYLSINSQDEDTEPKAISQPFMLYDIHLLQEFEISADRRKWDMDSYLRATSEVKAGQDIEEFISFDWLLTQVSNKIRLEGEQYSGPYLDSQDLDYFGDKLQLRASSDRAIVETSPYDRQDFNVSPPMKLGPTIIAQLSRTVNGVYWSNLYEELKIIFNENNPPSAMIYVNEKPWCYDLSSMNLLVKEDINAIAVLDGALAYERFGIDAYYGAIMLYLKPDAISKIRMKSSNAIFGNFVKARQFHSPKYATQKQIKTAGDDNRITLHWEPLLETDENGKAKVSFYTGDIPGKKLIVIQGFDQEGNLYYETARFVVKDNLGND